MAADLLKQGDEAFALGHNGHADLLTMDANGEISDGYMLLMHAEDQLMSVDKHNDGTEDLSGRKKDSFYWYKDVFL